MDWCKVRGILQPEECRHHIKIIKNNKIKKNWKPSFQPPHSSFSTHKIIFSTTPLIIFNSQNHFFKQNHFFNHPTHHFQLTKLFFSTTPLIIFNTYSQNHFFNHPTHHFQLTKSFFQLPHINSSSIKGEARRDCKGGNGKKRLLEKRGKKRRKEKKFKKFFFLVRFFLKNFWKLDLDF